MNVRRIFLRRFLAEATALLCLTIFTTPALAIEKVLMAFGVSPYEKLVPKLKDPLEREAQLVLALLVDKGIGSNNVVSLVDAGKVECGVVSGNWELMLAQANRSTHLQNMDKLRAIPIAEEPTFFLTYKGGPATLSESDIFKIFTDRVKNWRELGGQNAEIKIAIPANFKATVELLSNKFLKKETLRGHIVYFEKTSEIISYLKSTPGSIALTLPAEPDPEINHPAHPDLNRVFYFVSLGEPKGKLKKAFDVVAKTAKQVYGKLVP